MSYWMDYDHLTGDIRGFYPQGSAHPEGCTALTGEVWNALLAGYTRFRLLLPPPEGPIDSMDAFVPHAPEPVDLRSDRQKILDELAALDPKLPRSTEDLIEALAVDIRTLPAAMLERLLRKRQLREELAQSQAN